MVAGVSMLPESGEKASGHRGIEIPRILTKGGVKALPKKSVFKILFGLSMYRFRSVRFEVQLCSAV